MLMRLPAPTGYSNRCAAKDGYITPRGKLPSVTTVIGATASPEDKARLEAWLARPGAEDRRDAACARGNYVHQQVENWIEGKPTYEHIAYGGYWRSLRSWVETYLHSAIGIERPIWEPAGFAGSFDCLGYTYDSLEPSLLDWKTSARPKSYEVVRRGYFLQLAAYRAGIRWTYGIDVHQAHLVIAAPAGPASVFYLDRQMLDTCEIEFMHRLQQYQAQVALSHAIALKAAA